MSSTASTSASDASTAEQQKKAMAEAVARARAVVKAALRKLDTRFVLPGNALTQRTEEKLVKSIAEFGAYCRRVVMAPNWSENGAFSMPSGFQFEVVAAATPVLPFLFPPSAMYAGTFAVPLGAFGDGAERTRDGAQLTEAYVLDAANGVTERLLAALPDARRADGEEGAVVLGAAPADSAATAANYAGLFEMGKKGDFGWERSMWVVVRSHDAALSERLHALMTEAAPRDPVASAAYARRLAADATLPTREAPPHTTWEQFFFETPEVARIYNQQREHRATVARAVMTALNLASVPTVAELLASEACIDSVYNTVEEMRSADAASARNPVFLSDMVPTATIHATGVVLNESPALGPVVLRGPLDAALLHAEGVAGFPASTGKLVSVREKWHEMRQKRKHDADAAAAELAVAHRSASTVHTWEGASEHNLRLVRGMFRARTDAWKRAEQRFGYVAGADTELKMRPVHVKLTATAALP